MKDRLLKFINTEGLTPSLLATELGVHNTGIRHILVGRNQGSYDFIKKMLERFPKINAEWLILGKGPMYKSGEAKNDIFVLEEQAPALPAQEKPVKAAPTEQTEKIKPVEEPKPEVLQIPIPAVYNKKIKSMIVLYTDKTFATYMPED